MAEHPFISIVMPSYNKERFVREAIDSVLSQEYPRWELLVMDGGSTDGTLKILRDYGDKISWVSERDNGQTDALNKGFTRARGDIFTWLNADDLYEPGALRVVGGFFARHPQVMWACGHCSIVDERGREIRRFVSWYKSRRLRRYSFAALLTENFLPQMGVFFRREALAEAGPLDASLHYAMDYDLWLRLGLRHGPGLIEGKLARFRMYGDTKSVTGFSEQFREDLAVCTRYAQGHPGSVFWHRLNNAKIVAAYRLLAVCQRLRPGR